MILEKSELEEIKRWLKRGDIKRIAKDAEVTPQYASLVLLGIHPNHDVIEKAIERAVERKASLTSKLERLKQISL